MCHASEMSTALCHPPPDPTDTMMGKLQSKIKCTKHVNISELHAESKRARQSEATTDGISRAILKRWLCVHVFLHITFNCFYCCFYGNGRTLWSITDFPAALRGRGTDVMPPRLINYKCCMCVNIQAFGFEASGKPWSNTDRTEITNKLDNKWITQSQKYMEPDMLIWTWSHNEFTEHMATYKEVQGWKPWTILISITVLLVFLKNSFLEIIRHVP